MPYLVTINKGNASGQFVTFMKIQSMKSKYFLIFLVIFFSTKLFAQSKPYNVVFDLTSSDTAAQKSMIRWLKAISSSDSSAKLEVVLYGQSLDMVTKDKSVASNDILQLAANKNISFKVCSAAMKRHNLDKTQLLEGVNTVPDGIYEIITKQGEGWGYIKVAH